MKLETKVQNMIPFWPVLYVFPWIFHRAFETSEPQKIFWPMEHQWQQANTLVWKEFKETIEYEDDKYHFSHTCEKEALAS